MLAIAVMGDIAIEFVSIPLSPGTHYAMLASCSTAASKVKQLEGPSDDDDLPQSSGVQTNELMTASPPSATSNESVPVLNPCTDTAFFSLESHKPVTVEIVRQMIDIDYQCPICLEVFNDTLTEPYLTDCGHHLCCKCCDHLLNTSKTECPTCRKPDMLNNARCDKCFQRMVINIHLPSMHLLRLQDKGVSGSVNTQGK